MALIGPDSRCAICGGTLDRPYTATSGVAFACNSRLWPYCDAPLHWDCLTEWGDREEFSRGYFTSRLAGYWSNYGTLLSATPDWFLACGPAPSPWSDEPLFAEVVLATWPFRLYSKWGEWDEYVAGGFRRELAGHALDAADAAMTGVRAEAPSLEGLRALRAQHSQQPRERRSLVEFGTYLETLWGMAARRTDWRMLEERRVATERAEAERREARVERITRENVLARRLVIKLANGGRVRCPHCRRAAGEPRFVDRGPDAESFFICKPCGRSFSGSEAR